MIDIASSVLARLKNKADSSGKSYQLCLQLFCQEEFLRRLEVSPYKQNFVLKGGLFIYTLTGFDSRITNDIDFLLLKVPNSPDEIRTILEKIVSAETVNSFVEFEVKSVLPISVNKKYAGASASLVAKKKNTRTPINIDFGVGDVIIPDKEERSIPTQLSDFSSPTVNTYSLETTIAEKIDAVLSLMEYSSRMKDYYDLYYLANRFDFKGNDLTHALKRTFENRQREYSDELFYRMVSFSDDSMMVSKWNAFCRKSKIFDTAFDTVLNTINRFLKHPLHSSICNEDFEMNWDAQTGAWR